MTAQCDSEGSRRSEGGNIRASRSPSEREAFLAVTFKIQSLVIREHARDKYNTPSDVEGRGQIGSWSRKRKAMMTLQLEKGDGPNADTTDGGTRNEITECGAVMNARR